MAIISPFEVIERGLVTNIDTSYGIEGAGIDLSLEGLYSLVQTYSGSWVFRTSIKKHS